MAGELILTEVRDGVGVATFNRPEVMNAFTDDMRWELLAALEGFSVDDGVRCIVLTGAGRAFCAGGDIASMAALQDDDDLNVIQDRMRAAAKVVHLLAEVPKPTIAAVNGAAAGAGMNVALACDMRVGSDRALFSESFVKIGLVPDWGGFRSLTQFVGTAKAMELMMTGDRVDAAMAERLGLMNHVYPHETFEEQWRAFAHRLAQGPAGTLAQIKSGVHIGANGTLDDALAHEYDAQSEVFLSPDAREGMRSFLEKRPPEFT
ncbi:MAG: enoyl-CoA hydratase-related protein [Actinomycetota bacterium]|jgi:2-(1,2-epoxy-1,2-dihydrophenyl)acetyl-CoA isomerase|nr:enoyl-CoA hydratase-related protein [Actinomycetota bacterium]